MARAISSFPVPVSPWIRTVESVGATRSTCSSTASRAGLLPMTCSNLRGLWSWSPDPNLSKAPTEDLLALRVHSSVSGSILQSRSNTLEQNFVIERFCHELHGACSQRLHPHFFVSVCRDKDGRNPAMLRVQLGLQFQARHSRHADIRDQACSLVLLSRGQEFLRRGKRSRWQTDRFQQSLQCTAHQIIIIDNRYKVSLSLNGHDCNLALSPITAQSCFGMSAVILLWSWNYLRKRQLKRAVKQKDWRLAN